MNSDEQANDAMVGLNNKELEGRMLSVSVAREKENRSYGDKPFQRRNNHKNFF
jgi:RNA recognition motif-containing protein